MFHVVLDPQKALGEDLLKRVAALVGKEICDTRLLLSGEIPKIIASCQERGAADSIGRGLRDAGMAAFVCADSDLHNNPSCFVAHTARAGEREVIFGNRASIPDFEIPGGEYDGQEYRRAEDHLKFPGPQETGVSGRSARS